MKALLLAAGLLCLCLPIGHAQTPTPAAQAAFESRLAKVKALREAGRIPEAVAEFAKIGVHLAPDGIQEMYYDYAMNQENAGHHNRAVSALRGGIRAAPYRALSGMMHYQLAALFYNGNRYALAAPEFQAATRFPDEDTAWTWLLLGDCLHKSGQRAEARHAWQRAATARDLAGTDSPQAARARLAHDAKERSH